MKQLYQRVPCGHCEYTKEGKAFGCLACHHTGEVYVEVDPAELELKAVKVLDKIRKSPVIKAYSDVRDFIDATVSSVDLEEIPFASAQDMRETLVQAKAWKILYEEGEPDNEDQPNTLDHLLAQARAELDASRNEVRKKGDKTDEADI